MFKFIHYDIQECRQINEDGKRVYATPDGKKYPSVTTVLGSIPNPFLHEWRAKVGKVEAQKISNRAANRGTKLHGLCEAYLKSEPVAFAPADFEVKELFNHMKVELNKIEEVHALEKRIWSHKLRVAGTVDCIAKIDGKMYIVDFKTSSRFKSREDIDSYFMQCAAYSVAWYELTGIAISTMRILIVTGEHGMLVYDEPVRNWIPKFVEVRKTYDSL
jgi:hypothetical protein